MIKSMTGFASLTRDDEAATIARDGASRSTTGFSICSCAIPPSLAALESRLRALVQKRVARGRVEVASACSSAACRRSTSS